MSRSLQLLFAVVAAFAFAGATQAHHSFVATFDVTEEIRIEGEIAQFMYRNPHSLVQVLAVDQDGVEHRWAIEWATAGRLRADGVSIDTLRIGDHVVVTGNPGRRAEDYRMRMLSITRPSDGWTWGGTFE